MIDVLSTIFGQRGPAAFYDANGELSDVIQRVIYPNDGIALWYSDLGGSGVESVYIFNGDSILVDKEINVGFDPSGMPSASGGVQKYFPRGSFAPRWIASDMTVWWRQTDSDYGYSPGVLDPEGPSAGLSCRHRTAVRSNGADLWLDVDYFEPARDDAAPMLYSFGFLFDVAARTLVSMHDNLLDRTYAPR